MIEVQPEPISSTVPQRTLTTERVRVPSESKHGFPEHWTG